MREAVRKPASGATTKSSVAWSPLVQRGISGTPQPLPFLDRIQHSFGRYDITFTRAHIDGAAAEGANALHANAFTSGQDVAFARTPSLRVAAHEATHVLQQRAGVSAPDDSHEHQADAVAQRVAEGSSSEPLFTFSNVSVFTPRHGTIQCDDKDKPPTTGPSSQPSTQPSTQPATAPAATTPPLKYSDTKFTLPSPATGWTEATLETEVKKHFKTISVTGITATSPKDAKMFLLHAILLLKAKDNWGQEIDVVAPISRAAKAGDPDPVGRITVRIDETGTTASAELVATGAIPATPQTTVAAAETKLKAKATFGLASVRDDGTAKWSDAEISDVVDAMAMIPLADQKALQGVELIRVKALDGGFAGEFSTGGGVAKGATTVSSLPHLKLADEAFANLGVKFYGGTKRTVPASYNTVLHEVGHAVEKEVYRTAAEALDQAAIAYNKANVKVGETFDKHKKLMDEHAKLYKQWEAETDKTKKDELAAKIKTVAAKATAVAAENKTASEKRAKEETKRQAKETAMKATRVAPSVAAPFIADAATKKTAATTALTAAKTAVAALKPDEITASKAYVDALDATAKAIETFAKNAPDGKIGDLEKVVFAEVEKRNTERDALAKAAPTHPALATLNVAATAQDDWLAAERTAARAPKRTLRVQKFVDLVTTNKIEPFTKYAKDNWPREPAEFYAEAYALWLSDPDFLSLNYKAVYDFFQNGDYRK